MPSIVFLILLQARRSPGERRAASPLQKPLLLQRYALRRKDMDQRSSIHIFASILRNNDFSLEKPQKEKLLDIQKFYITME